MDRQTSYPLLGVAFANERVGVAVGHGCLGSRCDSLVLRTVDGGESWTQIPLPDSRLWRVAFVDSDTAVAVGSSIFHSGDGGITWTDVGPTGSYRLWDLSFGNETVGVAVGCDWQEVLDVCRSGRILRTRDGGSSWELQLDLPVVFGSVAFADADVVLATGEGIRYPWRPGDWVFRSTDAGVNWTWYSLSDYIGAQAFSDGQNGIGVSRRDYLMRTSDAGASWTREDSVLEGLYSIRFATPQVGMVAGDSGQLALTTDGGATWSSLRRGTTRILSAVASTDGNAATAVGERGTILHTDDGGESWTEQQTPTSSNLRSVSFVGSSTGVAVGGAIVRTDDGGITWKLQISGTALRGVFLSSPSTGTAVGERGVILRTTNGGESWDPQVSGTSNSLHGVFFLNENEGTVVGENTTILRTVDGGANWMAQSGPPNSHLESVFFSDSNVGIACGQQGKILRTRDGGLTWVLQQIGTGHLWSLSFVDELRGTIVGDGLILRTDDGGSTWTPQGSGRLPDLFGVSFFDSNIGTAVGFHGTILRTTTGGLPPR